MEKKKLGEKVGLDSALTYIRNGIEGRSSNKDHERSKFSASKDFHCLRLHVQNGH
jgi:hypothetical protein